MNQNISRNINLLITILSLSLIAGVALALKIDNADYIDFKPIVQPACDEEGKMYYDITDKATYICNGAVWIGTTVSGNISPATVTTTDGQLWLNDTDQEGNIYNTNYVYGYNDLRLHSSSSTINYSSIYLGDGAGKMITFYIDGDEKMKIDSAGDVIINQNLNVTDDTTIGGTLTLTTGFQSCDAIYTDADGELTCGGTADNDKVWKKDSLGVLGWADDAVGSGYWTQSGSNLYANDNGWNVGIGTLTPNGKLNVGGMLRVGLITNDDGGTEGYGDRLYLSGGDDWTTYDSENSDGLWIARYNVASDQSQLRINIGDRISDGNDRFIIGTDDSTQGGWNSHLTVRANGDVGIGTPSPSSKLHIVTASADDGINIYDDTGNRLVLISEEQDGGRMIMYDGGTPEVQLSTRDDHHTYFNHGGNIGIGTIDPDSLLDIESSGTPVLTVQTSAGSSQEATIIIAGARTTSDTTDISNLEFRNDESGGAFTMAEIASRNADGTSGTSNSDLIFRVNDGSSMIEAMRIDDTGNIGIGADNPDAVLHVKNTGPWIKLQDSDSTGNAHGGYIAFHDNTNTQRGWMGYGSSGNSHIYIYNSYTDGDIILQPAGGGYVGIKTAVPDFGLHLAGGTYADGLAIGETGNYRSALEIWYNTSNETAVLRSWDKGSTYEDMTFQAYNWKVMTGSGTVSDALSIDRYGDAIFAGDVTIGGNLIFSSAQTRYYAVSPFDFTAIDPDSQDVRYGRLDQVEVKNTSADPSAPIHLPNGAVIKEVKCYGSVSDSRSGWYLFRGSLSGSTNSAQTACIDFGTAAAVNVTVNNLSYSYRILTDLLNSTDIIYGCYVKYEVTSPWP